ncbi:catalase, partial [Janibacter sp. RAF20_2_2]
TKTWPHADYPLIEVGTMTLDENPVNFFAQIDQAAFAPSNTVPGVGFSPDKMLLGRVFAYADAHRARIGPNFHQLPVNRPAVERENHYSFDGPMRYEHSGAAPTYHPNSFGRPVADFEGPVDDGWEADGAIVRSAYHLHAEDDDFGQPGTLVREVFDDAQRDRLVDTVVGSLAGVEDPVLSRVFEYWTNIDATIGQRIRDGKAAADESPVDPGEVLGGQETHAAQG